MAAPPVDLLVTDLQGQESPVDTSASVVGDLLRTQGWGLDVLTFARKVRSVGIVVDHVSGAAAPCGVHFLLDGGRDEVFGGWCALLARDVA